MVSLTVPQVFDGFVTIIKHSLGDGNFRGLFFNFTINNCRSTGSRKRELRWWGSGLLVNKWWMVYGFRIGYIRRHCGLRGSMVSDGLWP